MAEARPRAWTMEDFLAFEAAEPERYEFIGGIVRMVTGDTAAHSAIKGNVAVELDEALRRGHVAPTSPDLKVLTPTAVMYPDMLVTCRRLAPDDDRLSDPTVAVEVLSPSTETHDRIRRWRECQTIASLQHFVLVAQSERRVEVYTREHEGWQLAVVEPPEDTVVLKAIGARLSLESIWEDSGR
jgi:Uma2 family endonuclease